MHTALCVQLLSMPQAILTRKSLFPSCGAVPMKLYTVVNIAFSMSAVFYTNCFVLGDMIFDVDTHIRYW